jgi:hypothetical protein
LVHRLPRRQFNGFPIATMLELKTAGTGCAEELNKIPGPAKQPLLMAG